jgi:arginine/lysine/ornithine decarboxylase
MTVREAMLGEKETLPVDALEGKICACVKSPCPPGIPLIVPGERIDGEMCRLLGAYGVRELEIVLSIQHKARI